jgi:hypothetical protein
MFPNRKDFGGTYLLLAEGQRLDRDWPNMTREIAVLWCAKEEFALKWRSIAPREPADD